MRFEHKQMFRAATVAATFVGLMSMVVTQPALADPGDENGAAVDLSQPSDAIFETVDGKRLQTIAVVDDVGERVVTGRTAAGEAATIVIQSVPVGSLAGLVDTESSMAEPGEVDENPGPIVETFKSELLPSGPEMWQPSFAYSATETTASFSWYLAADEFDVFVDGEKAGTSTGHTFELGDLDPGHTYRVEIVGSTAETGESLPASKTIELRTQPTGLQDPSRQVTDQIAPLTYQAYTTAFTHRTFIPEASVGAWMCNWGDSSYTFDGDNRSYSYPNFDEPWQTPNYRTLMFANVNWDNPAPYDVIGVKNVGQSVTRHNGAVVHATYASMDQMLFQNVSSGGAYAQVRFNHTSSNPHCKFFDANYGGSIKYNEIVRFYRSGLVEVVGWRKPVPAHEGYARFNTSGTPVYDVWLNVFQKPNQGFGCLIDGACANDTINASRSY
ncbi:MAG TPA: hypothetical protein VFU07_10355 [Candidatus Lumbricidophila sp.]|nr:hypothetical protein [Candidatus Lumbricidophila sp.]